VNDAWRPSLRRGRPRRLRSRSS